MYLRECTTQVRSTDHLQLPDQMIAHAPDNVFSARAATNLVWSQEFS